MKKLGIVYIFFLIYVGNYGCATAPAPVSVLPTNQHRQPASNLPNTAQPCPLTLTPSQHGQTLTGHFVVHELTHDDGSRRTIVDCGQGVTLTQPTWCAPGQFPDVVLSMSDNSPFAVFERYPSLSSEEWVIRIGEARSSIININFRCADDGRVSYIHHPIPLQGIEGGTPFLR